MQPVPLVPDALQPGPALAVRDACIGWLPLGGLLAWLGDPVMKRWMRRVALGLVGAVALLYLGDFAVLQLRVKRGTAFGTVTVMHLLATPLKGKKVEYDVLGSTPETCSQSIFPQESVPPCWWLVRHKTAWD